MAALVYGGGGGGPRAGERATAAAGVPCVVPRSLGGGGEKGWVERGMVLGRVVVPSRR